jgi:hypothetical protein
VGVKWLERRREQREREAQRRREQREREGRRARYEQLLRDADFALSGGDFDTADRLYQEALASEPERPADPSDPAAG